ncbi:hypothetical protein P7F60_30440, partial [Rhizobium sp. YJ-22]|nr:hypothetical protein [Rhizobium sp. YJ-22]
KHPSSQRDHHTFSKVGQIQHFRVVTPNNAASALRRWSRRFRCCPALAYGPSHRLPAGNGLLIIVADALPLNLFGSDGSGKLQGRRMASELVLLALAP